MSGVINHNISFCDGSQTKGTIFLFVNICDAALALDATRDPIFPVSARHVLKSFGFCRLTRVVAKSQQSTNSPLSSWLVEK